MVKQKLQFCPYKTRRTSISPACNSYSCFYHLYYSKHNWENAPLGRNSYSVGQSRSCSSALTKHGRASSCRLATHKNHGLYIRRCYGISRALMNDHQRIFEFCSVLHLLLMYSNALRNQKSNFQALNYISFNFLNDILERDHVFFSLFSFFMFIIIKLIMCVMYVAYLINICI